MIEVPILSTELSTTVAAGVTAGVTTTVPHTFTPKTPDSTKQPLAKRYLIPFNDPTPFR